jgi:competence protein ComGC
MKKNQGFTFIEVLLIFSAIAILVVVFVLTTNPSKKTNLISKEKTVFIF